MKFVYIGVPSKVHIYVYLSKWCKVPNSEFKISRCCDWKCQDIVSCEGPGLFVLNQVYWPIRGQFSGHVTRILTNQRPVSRSQSSFRVSSCTLWDDYPNWLWSGEKLENSVWLKFSWCTLHLNWIAFSLSLWGLRLFATFFWNLQAWCMNVWAQSFVWIWIQFIETSMRLYCHLIIISHLIIPISISHSQSHYQSRSLDWQLKVLSYLVEQIKRMSVK